MSYVSQILLNGILVGAVYALVSSGLALLFGVMKFLNIAHGSLIVLGGYVSYWAFVKLNIDPYLSVFMVLAALFLVGLVLHAVLLNPLVKLPNIGLRINNSMLITLGLVWVLDNVMALFWTADVRKIVSSYTGGTIDVFGAKVSYTGLAGFGIAAAAILLLNLVLRRTYLGKAVRATTQDAAAATLSGINVRRTYLVSSGIAVALAGVAGTVIVSSYSITPTGGLHWLLMAMVVMTLAGEESIWGVLPAGLILGLIEAASVFFTGETYREVVALVVFVLVLLLRPQGLFGRKSEGLRYET